VGEFLDEFRALPPYGLGALIVLLPYAVEAEIRFGCEGPIPLGDRIR